MDTAQNLTGAHPGFQFAERLEHLMEVTKLAYVWQRSTGSKMLLNMPNSTARRIKSRASVRSAPVPAAP